MHAYICCFNFLRYLHELPENDILPIVESKDLREEDLPPLTFTVTLEPGGKFCFYFLNFLSEYYRSCLLEVPSIQLGGGGSRLRHNFSFFFFFWGGGGF